MSLIERRREQRRIDEQKAALEGRSASLRDKPPRVAWRAGMYSTRVGVYKVLQTDGAFGENPNRDFEKAVMSSTLRLYRHLH